MPVLTIPLRVRRRAAGGAAGAPGSLLTSELAYNETDQTLYIGRGDNGSGTATSIEVVAGLGAFLTPSNTATLTNKAISGATNTLSAIPNAALTNSTVTVNGTSVALGASATITAASPNALTAGTGLTGGPYTGAGAVTLAVDTSVIATRAYVDASVQGFAWKAPVRVRTSSNVNLASPGATLDGVTMVAGDRVLVAGQTTASANGVYVWTAAASALTRASDADSAAELAGATVLVMEGTSADQQWTQTADSVTLGTTALAWAQVGGGTGGVTQVTNAGSGAALGASIAGSTLTLRSLIATAGSSAALGVAATQNANDVTLAVSGVASYAQGGTGVDLGTLTTGALLKKGASGLAAAVDGVDYVGPLTTISGGTF
jgi:hypothetical protein